MSNDAFTNKMRQGLLVELFPAERPIRRADHSSYSYYAFKTPNFLEKMTADKKQGAAICGAMPSLVYHPSPSPADNKNGKTSVLPSPNISPPKTSPAPRTDQPDRARPPGHFPDG